MKKVLMAIWVSVIACAALAQSGDMGNLLNLHNQNKPQSSIYEGKPFVFIDSAQPETPKSAEPAKLSDYQLPTYKIKTPFGRETTAAFVDHTTDFSTIIQVIDSDTLLVEERLQFINTLPTTFKRVLPLTLTNIKNAKPLEISLIQAQKNAKPVTLKTEQTTTDLTLTDDKTLQPGVHNYLLRYIVRHALLKEDASTRLALSLTGTEWPYPVERFSTLILFPNKTPVFDKHVFFGTNNVSIKDSFESQTDDKGNTAFHLTRPLPALADVKVVLFFDGGILSPALNETLSNRYPDRFVFGLILFAQLIYVVLSFTAFKIKKTEKNVLKFLTSWPLCVLRKAANRPLSTEWLAKMDAYATRAKRFSHQTRFLNRLSKYRLLTPIVGGFAWGYIAFKYVTTQLILIGALGALATQAGMTMGIMQYALLIGCAIVLTVIMVKWGALAHLRRNIRAAETVLLKKDFGFGLSGTASTTLFLQYYPYLLALGKEGQWIDNQKQYNPAIGKMTFEQGEK